MSSSHSIGKTDRNIGIDLLRIIAMYMIVLFHFFDWGGINGGVIPQTANYSAAAFIDSAVYCCVDCYALISGYVMFNRNVKLARILELWIQVFVYSVGITAVYALFRPQRLTINEYVNMLLPFSREQYWYICAYFALCPLIPLINSAIKALDRKIIMGVLAGMILTESILPTVGLLPMIFSPKISSVDPIGSNFGSSTIWIMALYIMGACVKKLDTAKKFRKFPLLCIYCGSVFFTGISKLAISYFTVHKFGSSVNESVFFHFTSPFVLLSAIALLLFASKLKITNSKAVKIIEWLSPLTFGVYLIHADPVFLRLTFINRASALIQLPTVKFVAALLGIAALIYLICSVIDEIRFRVFKLIRIKTVTENWQEIISRKFDKLVCGQK